MRRQSFCSATAGESFAAKALVSALRLNHARASSRLQKRAYTEDQRMDCWREERRGSIRNGKLKSASREARLERAKQMVRRAAGRRAARVPGLYQRARGAEQDEGQSDRKSEKSQ